MEPLMDKWKAFGWNVMSVNGHNMAEIVSVLDIASNFSGMPTVIIAHTVKGKGISFMEHDNTWHQKVPNETQYNQAMLELEGELKCL